MPTSSDHAIFENSRFKYSSISPVFLKYFCPIPQPQKPFSSTSHSPASETFLKYVPFKYSASETFLKYVPFPCLRNLSQVRPIPLSQKPFSSTSHSPASETFLKYVPFPCLRNLSQVRNVPFPCLRTPLPVVEGFAVVLRV